MERCIIPRLTGIQRNRSAYELLGKLTREEEMTKTWTGKEGGKVERNTTEVSDVEGVLLCNMVLFFFPNSVNRVQTTEQTLANFYRSALYKYLHEI